MRSSFGAMAAVLIGLLSLACNSAPPPRPVTSENMRPKANERAIESVRYSSIPKPDGNAFKLADFDGKVLIVDLWATWCGPCREQAPQLAELSSRYRDQGLEVVGLSLDERSNQAGVADFIKTVGINYTVGYASNRVSGAFLTGTEDETGEAPIPQLFIFGRDGKLVEHLIGYRREHGIEYLKQIVTKQLAKT
jgi:thiol-disulfide isomerase/thioredoxin